jgi:hypothetical protein
LANLQTFTTQFEPEEPPIERERLVDISNLQRDMVEAYDVRFRELSHYELLCQSKT